MGVFAGEPRQSIGSGSPSFAPVPEQLNCCWSHFALQSGQGSFLKAAPNFAENLVVPFLKWTLCNPLANLNSRDALGLEPVGVFNQSGAVVVLVPVMPNVDSVDEVSALELAMKSS